MKKKPAVLGAAGPARRLWCVAILVRATCPALLLLMTAVTFASAQSTSSRSAAPQETSSCDEKKTAALCREALLQALFPYCQDPSPLADPTRTTSWALGMWQGEVLGSPCREVQAEGSRPVSTAERPGKLADDAISREEPNIKTLGYLLKVVSDLAQADKPWEEVPGGSPLKRASVTLDGWVRDDLAARLVARHSAALFLLRAQVAERSMISLDFARDSERESALHRARAVSDLFPLDRRVLAARLIMARCYAVAGKFDDAFGEIAAVQKTGLEPETGLSRRLAALAWLHSTLQPDASTPKAVLNLTRAITASSSPLIDLALSPRGDVVITSTTGTMQFSTDDRKIGRLESARPSGVACNSARVSLAGNHYLTCDRGLYIDGDRKYLTAPPDDQAAENWARDLLKLRLVGVDGQSSCAFLDGSRGIPIVEGCRRVKTEPDNPFDQDTDDLGNLVGAGVFLPGSPPVAVEKKIRDGVMKVWVASRSTPAPASVAARKAPHDSLEVEVSGEARVVLDAEPDALGWISILYEDGEGFGLLVWNPQDRSQVVRAPIPSGQKKAEPSCVVPDGAGGVWIGHRNGVLEHFVWRTTR